MVSTLVMDVLVFSSAPYDETANMFANQSPMDYVKLTRPIGINVVLAGSKNVLKLA